LAKYLCQDFREIVQISSNVAWIVRHNKFGQVIGCLGCRSSTGPSGAQTPGRRVFKMRPFRESCLGTFRPNRNVARSAPRALQRERSTFCKKTRRYAVQKRRQRSLLAKRHPVDGRLGCLLQQRAGATMTRQAILIPSQNLAADRRPGPSSK
jgi:hypothetical protein